MELEEARNEAELLEGLVDYGQGYPPHLSDGEEACIVLNHRITELEAQRVELIRAAYLTGLRNGLKDYLIHLNDAHRSVYEDAMVGGYMKTLNASDKEDKG